MSNNIQKLGILAGTASLLFSGCLSLGKQADVVGPKSKPNVLFIMSDQHNAHALKCYGNKEISTPNLDKLARQGVLFENAVCNTPQCVPSRYSIWTGRYSRSTGTYRNGQGQNPGENTVADLFSKAGYYTGTIGKHHMFMAENDNHGFDYVSSPNGPNKPISPDPSIESLPWWNLVGENPAANDEHTCGLIMKETIKFLEKNKEHPFVLWCSFPGPHTPIVPSSPWARQYDPEKLSLPPNNLSFDENLPDFIKVQDKAGLYDNQEYHRITLAYYYGLISQIDYNIGLILEKLKELGLDKNTIVVYTADHGELASEFGAWTKGRSAYDATLRVPMIIKSPGVFKKGIKNSRMVCSIDLLPTLLDLSGLEIPSNIQGMSLKPLITVKNWDWREYAFTEGGNSTLDATKVVRSEQHKYIRYVDQNGRIAYEQFFDLTIDPWETQNRIADASYSQKIHDMKEALAKWDQETEITEPVKPPAGQRFVDDDEIPVKDRSRERKKK